MVILLYLFYIDIFYQLILIFQDVKNIYLISYFLHIFVKEQKHEILQNPNPFTKHTTELK